MNAIEVVNYVRQNQMECYITEEISDADVDSLVTALETCVEALEEIALERVTVQVDRDGNETHGLSESAQIAQEALKKIGCVE